IVTFIVYLSGLLPPHVPVKDLPMYWSMPVKKYLAAAHIHPGWSWLFMIGKGDFLNFVGIAFLAGVTILCYMRIIPIFFRKKDRVYSSQVVTERMEIMNRCPGRGDVQIMPAYTTLPLSSLFSASLLLHNSM